jgi:hypothetical protein
LEALLPWAAAIAEHKSGRRSKPNREPPIRHPSFLAIEAITIPASTTDCLRANDLDCTYSRKQYREQFGNNVPHDVPLVVIEFQVSVDVALERFANRRAHHAIDLTPAIVADKVRTYPYGTGTAIVDSELGNDEIRARILKCLGGSLLRRDWVDGGV